jgi:hypothetical protein
MHDNVLQIITIENSKKTYGCLRAKGFIGSTDKGT